MRINQMLQYTILALTMPNHVLTSQSDTFVAMDNNIMATNGDTGLKLEDEFKEEYAETYASSNGRSQVLVGDNPAP